MNSFEDLEVWKCSREFRQQIRYLASKFPIEEKYRLTDQIIRLSRSVTANISEGFGRFHHQENIQFCRTARGSLYETLDHLICASDEKYITAEELAALKLSYEHCLRLLNGYIGYLKKAEENQ